MERGNKKVKKRTIILISVLSMMVVIAAVVLIWRFRDNTRYIKMTEEEFYIGLLNWTEPDDVEILKVEAYYYNNNCYFYNNVYDMDYEKEERVYRDLVYYGVPGDIQGVFNLGWEDFGSHQSKYEEYLTAKEKGISYTFSEDEISQKVDWYYSSSYYNK